MSARNYTNCPKCREIAKETRDRRFREASAAYGKVDQTEFEEMMRTARRTTEPSNTLAEYHEWEFTSAGRWWMRYSCQCSDCGFAFEHKVDVPFQIHH